MNIVLDTNIKYGNWFLNNPSFDLLTKYIEISNGKLIIPRIVVEEIKNKYKEIDLSP